MIYYFSVGPNMAMKPMRLTTDAQETATEIIGTWGVPNATMPMSHTPCMVLDNDDGNVNANDDEDKGDQDNANDGNRRRLENSLFDLLSYSTACNILEYPLSCPYQWGAKALIDFNPLRDMKTPLYKKMTWVDWLAVAILIATVLLLLIPCFCMPSPERRQKWG
jgi:hypothetical protein